MMFFFIFFASARQKWHCNVYRLSLKTIDTQTSLLLDKASFSQNISVWRDSEFGEKLYSVSNVNTVP